MYFRNCPLTMDQKLVKAIGAWEHSIVILQLHNNARILTLPYESSRDGHRHSPLPRIHYLSLRLWPHQSPHLSPGRCEQWRRLLRSRSLSADGMCDFTEHVSDVVILRWK